MRAWWPEFSFQNVFKKLRELTLQSCLLTSICALWHMHIHPHIVYTSLCVCVSVFLSLSDTHYISLFLCNRVSLYSLGWPEKSLCWQAWSQIHRGLSSSVCLPGTGMKSIWHLSSCWFDSSYSCLCLLITYMLTCMLTFFTNLSPVLSFGS